MDIGYCPNCDDNTVTEGHCWICGADFNQPHFARREKPRKKVRIIILTQEEITYLRKKS